MQSFALEGVYVGKASPCKVLHVRDAGGSQGLRARHEAPHHVAHLQRSAAGFVLTRVVTAVKREWPQILANSQLA